MEFLQLPEGGHVLLTNTGGDHHSSNGGAAANPPPSPDILELMSQVERVAGPLPRPRGKQARRLRQAAAREADLQSRAATNGKKGEGGAQQLQQTDGPLASCLVS